MTAMEWANLAAYRFARFGPVGPLLSDTDWQDWASTLCNLPKLRQQVPPDPNRFDRFEDWARAFDHIITIGD